VPHELVGRERFFGRLCHEGTPVDDETLMAGDTHLMTRGVALQRCHQFVGRTTNWLYDHLRHVLRYRLVVFCDELLNRKEFPELDAWSLAPRCLKRRLWRRVAGDRAYPGDWARIRSISPRVVHSHFGDQAVEDVWLHRTLGVPWIVAFYGADVYELGRRAEWKSRYARVFNEATLVLALGPMMKAHLEGIGCPSEKVIIHPLGVDVESLPNSQRVRQRGEPLKILFAGTFREKKGVQYLIEAVALARRWGVRLALHLVGDAAGKSGDHETKEAAFRQISQLGLEGVTTHHSYLTFEDLVALALRLHVFVAPSVTAANGDAEGTPFVLQQMMATGMPAIATAHSDIPYLFGEHAHLLVPERDAGAIADRLQAYADDPDELIQHGARMRDQIRRAFDVRKCAAHLSDLYDASVLP
jgi:colanic acid/amylovoran biosynthesis glycosyltransferase